MGLFRKTSPEEKFAASPPGRALAAYERGDLFFQTAISASEVESWAEPGPKKKDDANVVKAFNNPDVLGQIEEIGWDLEHASWVFTQTRSSTRGGPSESSSTTIDGEIKGVYLFRLSSQH